MKVQFNKKTIIIVLIITAIILAIILGLIFFINWQGKKPIRIVEKFIIAIQEDDTKALEKLFDTKGFFAWQECNGKIGGFEEEYNKIKDNELKQMIKDYTGDNNIKEIYRELVGGIDSNISLTGEPTMEKIAPSMYEVTVKLKAKIYGDTRTQKVKYIVYKNKMVYGTPCS